ncbi:MAG: YncE family protein, partial [Chloroflexi bacterium]
MAIKRIIISFLVVFALGKVILEEAEAVTLTMDTEDADTSSVYYPAQSDVLSLPGGIGRMPRGIIFDDNGHWYIRSFDHLTYGEGISITRQVFVGKNENVAAMTANGNRVYALGQSSSAILTLQDGQILGRATTADHVPAPNLMVQNGSLLYTAGPYSDNVAVFSTATITASLVTTVTIGDIPLDMALAGGKTWISLWGGGVSVISNTTVITTVDTGIDSYPSRLKVDTDRNEVYVLDEDNDTLIVLDAGTTATKHTIPVGRKPIDATRVGNTLFVANDSDNTLTTIDMNTLVTDSISVPVGSTPTALAYNGTYLYVAGDDSVSIIDPAATTAAMVITTVKTGMSPSALAVDPTSGDVFVTHAGSNDVYRISGTAVSGYIPPMPFVERVATDSDGTLYLAGNTRNGLFVVEPGATIVAEYPITSPQQVAVNTDYIYVATTSGLIALDKATKTKQSSLLAGDTPVAMSVDPDTGLLYVAYGGFPGKVAVISDTTVLLQTTVSGWPTQIATGGGRAYVSLGTSIDVFDNTNWLGNVSVSNYYGISTLAADASGTAYATTGDGFLLQLRGLAVTTIGNALQVTTHHDAVNGYLFTLQAGTAQTSTLTVVSSGTYTTVATGIAEGGSLYDIVPGPDGKTALAVLEQAYLLSDNGIQLIVTDETAPPWRAALTGPYGYIIYAFTGEIFRFTRGSHSI